MTNSIIVYRNPLEQAFWEGLMNSGTLFPLIVGIVVFFIVFSSLNSIGEKFTRSFSKKRVYASNASLFISASVAIGIIFYMV